MAREREEGMEYLIISAYKPSAIRALPVEQAFQLVGLYSEGNFKQFVPCLVCKNPLFIHFNSSGEPEFGQCFDCGDIRHLYFTNTRNLYVPWKEADRK